MDVLGGYDALEESCPIEYMRLSVTSKNAQTNGFLSAKPTTLMLHLMFYRMQNLVRLFLYSFCSRKFYINVNTRNLIAIANLLKYSDIGLMSLKYGGCNKFRKVSFWTKWDQV